MSLRLCLFIFYCYFFLCIIIFIHYVFFLKRNQSSLYCSYFLIISFAATPDVNGIEGLIFLNLCPSPEDLVCSALFTVSHAFGYYLASNLKANYFVKYFFLICLID